MKPIIQIEDVMSELKKEKMSYKIIYSQKFRGEIPCKKVYENDHVLAFHDITPKESARISNSKRSIC